MKTKLYLALIAAGFLYVAYFFITHAFVIMRLTTVLGALLIAAFILTGVVMVRSHFR